MIRKLHQCAFRCRDSEETRHFYEDFLGLPLACTLEILETKTARATRALHTFYRLDDGSCLAFYEAPDLPFQRWFHRAAARFGGCLLAFPGSPLRLLVDG